ncbi:hypothetical protein R83H12_02359 [Fibrobacteria bacterium R8-3-H12]
MRSNAVLPTDVSVIVTYRCQMRCKMCGIWENPTEPEKEIKAKELEILPKLKFANVTGGEPFLRDDLEEIVEVLYTKNSVAMVFYVQPVANVKTLAINGDFFPLH